MPVPPELMQILQCPVCRSRVEESGDTIVCTGCGLVFPVKDGIPHMLVEEARPSDEGGLPLSDDSLGSSPPPPPGEGTGRGTNE